MTQDGSRSGISSNPSEWTPAALFGSNHRVISSMVFSSALKTARNNRVRRLSRWPGIRLCSSVGGSASADKPRSETLRSASWTGGPGVAPRPRSLSGSRSPESL